MDVLTDRDRIHVEVWPDAVLETHGFEARSPYVERYWLALLGPTATWLMRRLADVLEEHPDGADLALADLAHELGVGHRSGRHAPFLRTLQRCQRFGLVAATERGLRVRRHLPPLTRHQLSRLPADLQRRHAAEQAALEPGHTEVDELRERARGSALALVDRGLAPHVAERVLHEQGTHPAMAHAAVRWALEHRGLVAPPARDGEPLPPAA